MRPFRFIDGLCFSQLVTVAEQSVALTELGRLDTDDGTLRLHFAGSACVVKESFDKDGMRVSKTVATCEGQLRIEYGQGEVTLTASRHETYVSVGRPAAT